MALSERRKVDRHLMAETIEAKAVSYGFHATIEQRPPRETWVEIRTRHGLYLTVDFDGTSPQPDVFVLPWHIRRAHTKLSREFGVPGCEVNPYHFQKLTAVAYGFADLMRHLDRQFSMIRDGSAFQADSFPPTTTGDAAMPAYQ
jgi:hypothetical protein